MGDIINIINILKSKFKPKAPWEKFYAKKERTIKIPEGSIYQLLEDTSKDYRDNMAYNYFGKTASYKEFLKEIDEAARSFRSLGIRPGDIVTVCMPNTPEAIISFYALNKIGAISNMIHPLSGENEMKEYLISTNSVMLVMIDLCYEKIKNILSDTSVYKTIVVSVKDSMPFFLGIGYSFTQGFKIKKPKKNGEYIYWKDFLRKYGRYNGHYIVDAKKDNPAVILHSGGTTGNPKGIVLTNGNFNSFEEQAKVPFCKVSPGDSVLTIMPIFHGFGLGVSVHVPLCFGVGAILVPKFDYKKFDKLLDKYKPNVIFGVPALYNGLVSNPHENLDLSYVKYFVYGGDAMTVSLSRKINIFLREHGAKCELTQGYGMTESLAATAFSGGDYNKEGSIGIPLPGNYYKIVTPNTDEEVAVGVDGEICVHGPTVMLGYLDNEKETNEVLRIHSDGKLWLHTGDMGMMDEDGVFFYRQRIKRMLISSGYNIYPGYIEGIISEHEAVLNCSVIGIPHPHKGEVAKAYIVLKNDAKNNFFVKKSIKEHCERNLAKYSVPYEYEFRESLPKTLIGKIDFKQLEKESREKK